MGDPQRRPRRLSSGRALLSPFGWFALGIATWFAAWGIQMVVFSWLVVGTLRASAEWVGIAQTSTMLPALFLVLFGGAAADRLDPRRMVVAVHAVAVVPVALLALAVSNERLTLWGLGVYGIAIGTLSAFSDVAAIARDIEERLAAIKQPLKIAVMGCEVNGPGEAREADIGIAGSRNQGVLFKKGLIIKKCPSRALLREFYREIGPLLKK